MSVAAFRPGPSTLAAGGLAADPPEGESLHRLGLKLLRSGSPAGGLENIDRAIALMPDSVEALNSRGVALLELQRRDEALAAFDLALSRRPHFVGAHLNRGAVLFQLARLEEALASFEQAAALEPGLAEAHHRRGVLLARLGRHETAVAAFDRALALRPDLFDAHLNRGVALAGLRRFEPALAAFEAALALRPNDPEAHNNRGHAFYDLGRDEEARASYDLARALAPGYSDAIVNRGLLALREGDFAAGWRALEARWSATSRPRRTVALDAPLWSGEPLQGRSLVVYEEQGLGDVIQFCRYLTLLEARGGEVTLIVRASLAALMRSRGGRARVLSALPEGVRFDFQCPLMSLPLAFGTDLRNVPAPIPYLAAEPSRVRQWGERIGAHGFKVGVCWAGSELAQAQGRGVAPERLLALAAPGVRLISLQYAAEPPAGIESLGPGFNSGPDAFLDSAAAMMNLDLVVSVDTSAAHLAGALGRSVWLALPSPADWRWLRAGADSPWYPTMRLFRQRRSGDWTQPLAEIAAALRAWVDFSF